MTDPMPDIPSLFFQAVYWLCVALVAFTYVGYPLVVWWRARFRGRPVRLRPSQDSVVGLPRVSVVLAVRNEEQSILRRLKELTEQIATQGLVGEVVVVSDGSTDRTVEIARGFVRQGGTVRVRLIELKRNVGKAVAVTVGVEATRFEIVALADARQTWARDAIVRLLENFDDPEVGAVSGELVLQSEPGVMASVGLYWRFEKWLRRRESLARSTVGLTGSICAVRRHLFRPIPSGTLLDDVYWPLCVAMRGYRVVFDGRALAFDRLPPRVAAEFRRKVRTLSGNFQLVARLPESLLPWRNPVWFQLVSHKLARLVVPWAWLAALGLSAAAGGAVYSGLFAAQLGVTLVGLAGLHPALASRSRIASAAGSFLVLNAAAWCSLLVWMTGRAARSWNKTAYHQPTTAPVPALAFAGLTLDDTVLDAPALALSDTTTHRPLGRPGTGRSSKQTFPVNS